MNSIAKVEQTVFTQKPQVLDYVKKESIQLAPLTDEELIHKCTR